MLNLPVHMADHEARFAGILGGLSEKQFAATLVASLAASAAEGDKGHFDSILAACGNNIVPHIKVFKNPQGQSVLGAAASGNNHMIVRTLLKWGACANNGGNEAQPTPLSVAVARRGIAVMKELLAGGADPLIGRNGEAPPLHAASAAGYTDGVRVLLGHRAVVVDAPGKWFQTPLYLAVHHGHPEVALLLRSRGARLSVRPNGPPTPPGWVQHPDYLGIPSLLEKVAQHGSVVMITALLGSGRTNEVAAACRQSRVLLYALGSLRERSVESERAEVVREFVKAGARVDERTASQKTALLLAAGQRNPPLGGIEAVLEAGADVNATDSAGNTATHLACMVAVVGVVELLLRFGGDGRIANLAGKTALDVVGALREDTPHGREENGSIREMLARDTSWRRRGWVLVIRSRRTKENQSAAKLAEASGLVRMVDTLVGLPEEGIIRAVLSYL